MGITRIKALLLLCLSLFLALPFPAVSALKTFTWSAFSYGVTVRITLTTEELWVTNNTYTISFSFTVQKISGQDNSTYSNSYVILKSVSLDPSLIGKSASPSQNLTEGQTATITWNFTPKANDLTLSVLGIAKGKQVQYSLDLDVEYIIVDSEGNEWPSLFQTLPPHSPATITIMGGNDAPEAKATSDNLFIVGLLIVGVMGLGGVFKIVLMKRKSRYANASKTNQRSCRKRVLKYRFKSCP